MCGIFGITNFKGTSLHDARNALHTLTHRGPDQWDEYVGDGVYLGHRRLSILDLSESGRQPMISDDGNIVIIVNGEIYNYKELKKEIGGNESFKSSSDSEVLIHGYRKWGIEKLLEKLEGMYAFAIFDNLKKEMYVARDRVGIKPLFYAMIDNEIVFASELKAIQTYFNHRLPPIDYTSLYDFLTYRYIPAPKTMFKNIFKLEPAHYLHIKLPNNSSINRRYWSLDVNNNGDTLEKAITKINELVDQSVDEQMMSDVPLGFFLSGGIDSSTVVSVAAKKRKNINTFSIGFSEESHDETHFADLVSELNMTNHKKMILNEFKTAELFENLKTWFDEPFADFSCFPTYLVSKFAKENATVALTGDGGDEVFGGYNWYNEFLKKSKFRFPSLTSLGRLLPNYYGKQHLFAKVIRKIEYPHLLDDLELYTKILSGQIRKQKTGYRNLWEIPHDYDDYWNFRKFYKPDLDLFTRLQYLDFHTFLPDDILTKVDRVSMAVSLECRVPLLSTPLIEYVYCLPENVRYHNGVLKGAMKKAFSNILPAEIIHREKKGFSIPMNDWAPNLFGSDVNLKKYILKNLFSIDV
jgi:asparagine synthase (glutamine-hydrolysing)